MHICMKCVNVSEAETIGLLICNDCYDALCIVHEIEDTHTTATLQKKKMREGRSVFKC